ncbi:acetyltransferase (GNAT) family protein [Propionicimonas paludicola]|uniref:Acetyltransferase (GNAT) family protein n=1 Tax=Propionicimonas paludicola TaxID=185243 RepID=A0A2A9CV41_9ACTN|nr:GNAT family acetyltransferase [Propionicimonas paludicola]PFG17512.1 acetyltransferase (GNAT) family protein [Propionicimonas paludicola]
MIEALGSADATAAVALWEEADLNRPWNDAGSDFRRALESPSSTVLGIRDGGRLVGTAMVGWDGHRGWVYYLAVAGSHRGRGLGRELMAAAEHWLKEVGAPKIQFMVRTENDAVLSFYDHLGYIPQYCVVLGRRLD